VDSSPQQAVQAFVRARRAGRRAGEDEIDVEPGSCSRCCGKAAVVRPATPGRDERVGSLGKGSANEEFEVPELVTAERQGQQILALDPDFDITTEGG
jgi:hypothetical protein